MKSNRYKLIIYYKDKSYTTWKCKSETTRDKAIALETTDSYKRENIDYITSQMYPLKHNKVIRIEY